MMAACGAGARQREEGLGHLGKQARAHRQGQGLGQGGEGRPQGHRGSGPGSKNRALSGEPYRLLSDLFSSCLLARPVSAAAWRELILEPQGSMGPKQPKPNKAGCRGWPTKMLSTNN